MARTRQFEEFTHSTTELAIAQADASWGNVARQDSSTGDGTGSVNGESLGPADKSYLPFASKISLIRDILGDKVPMSVDSVEDTMRVTSLLSTYEQSTDSSSDHLPLAAVVRSALSATSSAMRTATREIPLAPVCDGLPLNLKALKGTAKYYQVS